MTAFRAILRVGIKEWLGLKGVVSYIPCAIRALDVSSRCIREMKSTGLDALFSVAPKRFE
jgi:hypothetical protein